MHKIKPTLIVIAGPNGSGKTSVTGQILNHRWVEECVYINPDNIAQEMFGGWNNHEGILKAAQYAQEQRIQLLKENKSFIFETVFSAIDKVLFLKQAKEQGYFIRFFFVGTNHPSINASRIANRVLKGGHDVPITKIINRYFKSIQNCCNIAKLIDRLYVYDNSEELALANLLFRAKNGKLEKSYGDINNWAMPIFNSLNN
jgi:predicted ABC-type ATPase